jgi:hypothetical protein
MNWIKNNCTILNFVGCFKHEEKKEVNLKEYKGAVCVEGTDWGSAQTGAELVSLKE